MNKRIENNIGTGMTAINEVNHEANVLTGNDWQGMPDFLLERLIMVTLQVAALHESLKDLIETCVADSEAKELT